MFVAEMMGFPSDSFNRTIVELKYYIRQFKAEWLMAFNRTIVELKCACNLLYPAEAGSFNRTIVELK